MGLGWSGLGVGDFITINRTLGLECDQSSEKFSFRSMSVDAVGGVRVVAVLCGDVALGWFYFTGIIIAASRRSFL